MPKRSLVVRLAVRHSHQKMGGLRLAAVLDTLMPLRLALPEAQRWPVLPGALALGAGASWALQQVTVRSIDPLNVPPNLLLDLLALSVSTAVSIAVALGGAVQATNLRVLRLLHLSTAPRTLVLLAPCLVAALGTAVVLLVAAPSLYSVLTGSAGLSQPPWPETGAGGPALTALLHALVLSFSEGVLLGVVAFLVTGAARQRIPILVLIPVAVVAGARWVLVLVPDRIGFSPSSLVRASLIPDHVLVHAASPVILATGRVALLLVLVAVISANTNVTPLPQAGRPQVLSLAGSSLILLAMARLVRSKVTSTALLASLTYTTLLLVLTARVDVAQRTSAFESGALVSLVAFGSFGATARGGLGRRATIEHRHGGSPALVIAELWAAALMLVLAIIVIEGTVALHVVNVATTTTQLWALKAIAATSVGVAAGALLCSRPDQLSQVLAATLVAAAAVIGMGHGHQTIPAQSVMTATALVAAVVTTYLLESIRWRDRT